MPSFFHLMVGLGGTALAVGAAALWLHEPPQQPTSPGAFIPSSRMAGKSALSHGTPSPAESPTAAGSFSRAFQIGQKVIVVSEPYASRTVSLLSSPPDSGTSTPASGVTRTLPGGTVVKVSGMRVIERVPGRAGQYYEVTLPEGGKGWLPERALRVAANED
jgi:hypothetical protein